MLFCIEAHRRAFKIFGINSFRRHSNLHPLNFYMERNTGSYSGNGKLLSALFETAHQDELAQQKIAPNLKRLYLESQANRGSIVKKIKVLFSGYKSCDRSLILIVLMR